MSLISDRSHWIRISLSSVRHELQMYVQKKQLELDEKSGWPLQRAVRLLKDKVDDGVLKWAELLLQLKLDDELLHSVFESIQRLDTDWLFLNLFMESLCIRTDAYDVNHNSVLNSIVPRIEAVGGEIGKHLHSQVYGNKYYAKRPLELLKLLLECQRKTDELTVETAEVLEYLSRSTFQVHSPDDSFWTKFVDSVKEGLKLIEDGSIEKRVSPLCLELEFIQWYLDGAQPSIRSNSNFRGSSSIDGFLKHVASVVVRIAIRSCHVKFRREHLDLEFVDLYHEVDPANLEFLKLNLKFQEALYKIGSRTTVLDDFDFVGSFCCYLLTWNDRDDLNKEVKSMVTLSITADSRSCGENCFEEIVAVLGEAAFLHRSVLLGKRTFHYPSACKRYVKRAAPPCSELLAKICLLKVELYLKAQLAGSRSFKDDMILKTFRGFTKDVKAQEHKGVYVKKSLEISDELCDEVESLFVSLNSQKITMSMLEHSLLQLLFKIVFFKVESFLTELSDSRNTYVSHVVKYQIESLVEDTEYFKRIVMNKLVRSSVDEEVVINQVEAVAQQLTIFSYACLPDHDKFEKLVFSLPRILDMVKSIKAKLKEIDQQFPKLIFPQTYELGFIDFLGRGLRMLVLRNPESIAPVKHHMVEVQLHLESFKFFLIRAKGSDVEHTEFKDLRDHIRDLVYKLEYVVESIEVHGHLQHSLWLYDLLEDIRLADQQVSKIEDVSSSCKVRNLTQVSSKMISQDAKAVVNEMILDLADEQDAIFNRLTQGSLQCDVVSIVGMAGSGKTTLAKRLYENNNVICRFHCRAWCTVSQAYSKRELLLEILSHIICLNDEIQQMPENDLQAKLRRCLLRNRYIVVLDDVWDIVVWNDLKNSFPDNHNGSRILITSRLQGVVSDMKPGSTPHCMRLLSGSESWMLLKKKVFKDVVCPDELLQVGEEIARKCRGLPLAVVAIAGILQRTEKMHYMWKKISKSLNLVISSNPESRCMEILEQSYKHLPEYLKACFLYLGVFVDHNNIPVTKLMRYWVAEGLIQESIGKSLEDVAENCLMELIQRNLVIVSKIRADGRVKSCRLHDLLHDLCLSKAKEENFFQLVTKKDEPYSSFLDSDYDLELEDDNQLAPAAFESYRLAFYLKRNHFIDSRPAGQGTRTLIFSASTDLEPKCPYDISFISHNFKLLRVLDLEWLNIESSFPVEIGQLVQLRYLSVSGYIKAIPPSIGNLWKLETLVVKGLRGKVILPETIWSMAALRHLHVNNHVAFNLEGVDEQVGVCSLLENLVSFSTPSLRCGEDSKSIFMWMPNLRKLRCIFFQSRLSPEKASGFPVLEHLTQLESLKIIYYGGPLRFRELVFPLTLKKLSLSNFQLQRSHINQIGELPNLRVLKLLAGGFEEQVWEMREEDFKELTFLELDSTNIVEWNASYEHLPSLERLVLRNCKYLDKIPSDFAYIITLQEVEVHWCNHSVDVSAQEIGDMTIEIKVLINRSELLS